MCPRPLLQSLSHLPCSRPTTPQLRHVRAVPVLLVPRGEQPCAIASSSAGDPRPVSRCSRGAALPKPRPFPRWSLRVCVRAFPPGTICISLCFKVPALPPRKEINGVKLFTSRASEAAGPSGFICCREVWGCRGAAVGWKIAPWCLSCPRPQVQGGSSPSFVRSPSPGVLAQRYGGG